MPVLSGQLFPLGRKGVAVPPLAPPLPLPGLNLRKCKAPYPATMETRMGGKGSEGGEGREGKGREGKGREGKGREGKGREGNGRGGKGREGKGRGEGRGG